MKTEYKKQCPNCGEGFPSSMKINGKKRSLSGRVYCLECSPYGSGNQSKLSAYTLMKNEGMKKCLLCSENKSTSEFYKNKNGIGGFASYCKECNSDTLKQQRRELKIQCINYLGGKCAQCGYNKCPGAMDFHHSSPTNKGFSIAGSVGTAFNDKIKLELDKCILLCANCHRENHYS